MPRQKPPPRDANEILRKNYPQDLDAERYLLGCLLLDPSRINFALEIVGTEDFYLDRHRLIFDSMRRLAHIGIGIDAITIKDDMRMTGVLEESGGPAYLAELAAPVETAVYLPEYARIVRRCAMSRRLITRATEWSKRAFEEPAEDLYPEIELELTEMAGENGHRLGSRAQGSEVATVIGEAERGELGGWSTGFHNLDDTCGGLYPGDLVIIGGSTSIGKSILALNIVEHFASCRRRALFFSIEMTLKQLIKRSLSARSRVSLSEVRRDGMKEDWHEALLEAAKVLAPMIDDTLELWDVKQFTPGRFRIMTKAAKARGSLAIACVDFIQLMHPDTPLQSKEQEMAHIAQALKDVARELNIVVIGVSQLNREWKTQNRRPTKEDLKYAGAIEQAADTIMLLYPEPRPKNEREGNKYLPPNRLILLIDKQRNERTAHLYLHHDEGRFRFEERMNLLADSRSIPLRDGCVQTVVTSPPYWGLRDYGTARWEGGDVNHTHGAPYEAGRSTNKGNSTTHAGRFVDCICGARRIDRQIGLEATPEAFVATMVQVFREVWRVLRDDGTLWLNLGDSYNGAGHGPDAKAAVKGWDGSGTPTRVAGLKPKDLCGMPWRVAFALQADGWYLRSDIVWAKPNPMPESVTDRPTRSHEYLFLLAKNQRYFYDSAAIREEAGGWNDSNFTTGKTALNGDRPHLGMGERNQPAGRNKRDVWTVNSEPTPEAHFATFPQKLIEPCILAGSRSGDLVLDPFHGSGTVGRVCERFGRRWVGLDLNPAYLKISKMRTAQKGLGI